MRRTTRPLAALLAAAAVVALGASPALARSADEAASQNGAGGGRSISVDRVDATGGTVVVDGVLHGAEPGAVKVVAAGRPVTPRTAVRTDATGRRTESVLVLDNSAALGNTIVQLAKDGAAPFLPGAGTSARTAVVSTGGGATVQQAMTSSSAAATTGLERVAPSGTSALWDSLIRSADLFSDASGPGTREVVVFAAGADTASKATASAAGNALRRAGAQLRVVALPGGVDLGRLQDLVGSLGGSLVVQESDAGVVPGLTSLGSAVRDRYRLELPATGRPGTVVPLTLTLGTAGAEVAYEPGEVTTGALALAPVAHDGGVAGAVSRVPGMKVLLVLLGAGAAALLVWAVLSLVLPDENSLGRRLAVYEPTAGDGDDDAADASVATTALIKRAVAFTGDMAEKRGILESTEQKLEYADIPLRAAEALFLLGAAGFVAFMLGLVATQNVLIAVVLAAVTLMLPKAVVNMKVRRRQKAFQAQLPDMLALLSGTLRAGYSIAQGFEAVSREIDDPMGRELRRVVTESRLGRPLEEALEAVAERMDSEDFAWAVMAIRIQREVGGNLAELLMTVSETMTQRERLRRDVLSLTAEGRMSAFVLGMLPPGLGVVMWVMNPTYIARLFQPGLGYTLLGISVVAMLIGFAWMKKIITVEV